MLILTLLLCVFAAFVALFTFPKVYENNKTEIDAQVSLLRSKAHEIEEKYVVAINSCSHNTHVF